jgi:hypothetical protein
MIQVHSYEGVGKLLGKRFREDYRRKDVNITGLIFGLPDTPLGKTDYIPIVDYWHYRSDNVTDFLCAGFGEYGGPDAPKDAHRVAEIRNGEWWFSTQMFVQFIEEIEKRSSWIHQNRFEVIICAARYRDGAEAATLDFSSAAIVALDDAKMIDAVSDLSGLLTMIFQFAKSINEDTTDAAWEWSDRAGIFMLKRTLKEMLLSWLPKWLGKGEQRSEMFVIQDITPKVA